MPDSDQVGVPQSIPHHARYDGIQLIDGVQLPVVVSAFKFGYVSVQVFGRHLVIRSVISPIKLRPE